MVHTRSLEGNTSHEREARVRLKQQINSNVRLTRRVKKVLSGSLSSSDSSDSDSKQVGELPSSSRQTTKQSPQLHAIADLDNDPYVNESADSTCSETQILIETGRLHCTRRKEEFSIPLELLQPTAVEKREIPLQRTRAREAASVAEILENEVESSFSDDSCSEMSWELVEKEPRLKKLSRTRRTSEQNRKEFADSDFSDFEIDVTRELPQCVRTGKKRETLFRQARRTSRLTTETSMAAEQRLEAAEKGSSLSDQDTSGTESSVSVVGEKSQRFKSLLEQKLAQKRATNGQCREDSSDSDSEMEKRNRAKQRELPARTIRLPSKYGLPEQPSMTNFRKDCSIERSSSVDRKVTRASIPLSSNGDFLLRNIARRNSGWIGRRRSTDPKLTRRSSVHAEKNETRDRSRAEISDVTPAEKKGLEETPGSATTRVTRRNISVQKQTNDNAPNYSPAKTTSGKNDFHLRKMQVALTRAEFTPEFLRLRRSEEISETSTSVGGGGKTNKTTRQNETTCKSVETDREIEDLLRQLQGSSDSEEERSREKTPAKQKRRGELSSETNRRYVCHVCDQRFASKESLRSHEDLHSGKKKRKCKYCNETFARNDNYLKHLRKHNMDLQSRCVNTFKCDVCEKLFAYRHVLRRHQLTHENRADFKCKTCDRKFVRNDYLKAHERLQHSENPYFTCGICDKQFAYKHSKILHERTHTNEKPYKCRICSAAFSRKDNFKKHKVTHQIKRARFLCDDCDEVFANKFTLQIHVQDHLKIKEISEKEDYHVEVVQVFINEDWD